MTLTLQAADCRVAQAQGIKQKEKNKRKKKERKKERKEGKTRKKRNSQINLFYEK